MVGGAGREIFARVKRTAGSRQVGRRASTDRSRWVAHDYSFVPCAPSTFGYRELSLVLHTLADFTRVPDQHILPRPTESRGMFFFCRSVFRAGHVCGLPRVCPGCKRVRVPTSVIANDARVEGSEAKDLDAAAINGDEDKAKKIHGGVTYCTPSFLRMQLSRFMIIGVHNRPSQTPMPPIPTPYRALIRPTSTRGTTAVLSGPFERQSPRVLGL